MKLERKKNNQLIFHAKRGKWPHSHPRCARPNTACQLASEQRVCGQAWGRWWRGGHAGAVCQRAGGGLADLVAVDQLAPHCIELEADGGGGGFNELSAVGRLVAHRAACRG